jgi:hypothetical protein
VTDRSGLLGSSTIAKNIGEELAIPNTCGSCQFAQILPGDGKMVMCGGVPPTPVPMGVRQNLAMKNEIVCQMMRPQMSMSERGCALYKPREIPVIGKPMGAA